MNELIVNADGTVTCVGDAGSVSGILAELVEANTVPAERDADGVETKSAIVPDANTLAVEVLGAPIMRTVLKTPAVMNDDGTVKTPAVYEEEVVPDDRPLLKTHAWRLPKARAERLEDIRGVRNTKLNRIDVEIDKAAKNQPGYSRTVANSEVEKQALRDLPPKVTTAVAALNNTDDISAYTPDELK